MFGIGLVELALFVVTLGLSVTVLIVLATNRSGMSAAREWRWVRLSRLAGLALGILIAWMLIDPSAFGVIGDQIYQHVAIGYGSHADLGSAGGVSTMVAPVGFGLGVLLGAVAGETVVRPARPTGPRTASLEHRSLVTYLPRNTSYAVGIGLALLGATLLLTTLTAWEDTYLGGRRAIGCTVSAVTQIRTPYPGSFYSVPLAIALGIVLVTAAAAAVVVVRRPRGLAPIDAGDDMLRGRSMTVIIAAVGVAVGVSLAGIAGTAATALLGLDTTCAGPWIPIAGWALVPVTLSGIGLTVWCFVLLFVNDTLTIGSDAARPVEPSPEHA
ncbi:hypothetical protein WBG06_20060 [Nocardioides sp. CCNWLW239]|uniref:hypothetical protein n=1 Tax=Nocardioides sp. CCNWLW239 TaxID=3128902 RepID=UPI003016D0FA